MDDLTHYTIIAISCCLGTIVANMIRDYFKRNNAV